MLPLFTLSDQPTAGGRAHRPSNVSTNPARASARMARDAPARRPSNHGGTGLPTARITLPGRPSHGAGWSMRHRALCDGGPQEPPKEKSALQVARVPAGRRASGSFRRRHGLGRPRRVGIGMSSERTPDAEEKIARAARAVTRMAPVLPTVTRSPFSGLRFPTRRQNLIPCGHVPPGHPPHRGSVC